MRGRRRREDDEDPFRALREATPGSSFSSSPAPPSSSSPAQQPPSPSPSPQPVQPRGAGATVLLLAVTAAIFAGAGVLVWQATRGGGASVMSSAPGGATDGQDAHATPIDRRAAAKKRPSTAAAAVALVEPSGFRRALATLRRTLHRGEVVTTMRLDRSRLVAISHDAAGDQRVITISPRLAVSISAAGHNPGPALPLSSLDPSGPWRATRAAAARGHFSTRRLDYLAITASIIRGQPSRWSLFFTGVPVRDRLWQTDLRGDHTHRPDES
jgi:hypothetical protein